MSVIEAMGRVDQIRSSLLQLSRPGTAASSGAGALASAAASTDFAQALSSVLGPQATPPAGGVSGPPLANPGAATGADVAAAAKKYLGVPYVFGGEDSSGMDCSGLVQRVYADLGIEVPRLVSGQMKIGTEVGSLAEAQPGDLIVTGGGDHILIYAGNNKVIHAPYEGRTVSLVDAYMNDGDIDTIRRIIPAGSAPAAARTTPLGAAGGTDLVASAFAAAIAALGRGER
jgi:cell wall-associated NlpC family hydrolase